MNKKKIIFTIWSLSTGGAERSLINLLSSMNPDNYEIDLLLFRNEGQLLKQLPKYVNMLSPSGEISFLSSNNFKEMVKCFSFKCFIKRIIYMLFYRNKAKSPYNKDQVLWQYVWKKCVPKINARYDIAIGYMHSIPSYYVLDKVEAYNKMIWIHHDYSKLKADYNFDYQYFNKADFVVTVSDICMKMLTERFPDLKEKFIVLQNINSAEVIYKLAEQFIPEEYGYAVNNAIPILLSLGRLHEVKGFDLAIDAALLLKNAGYTYIWFIIGDGELRENLKIQINKKGLSDNVFLLGRKQNPYPYIKHADIIIQTSRNEGKSMVLDEAKVLCKPIISTIYDSVGDQIVDGKTGLLTEISSQGIYKSVKTLLSDKELQKKLIFNLQNKNYDTTSEMEKYNELFRKNMSLDGTR